MDPDEISKYFPIWTDSNKAVVPTGFDSGIILRFKTFYLKIYDDQKSSGYNVIGCLYDTITPKVTWEVPYNDLQEFGSRFTHDNYLNDFCCK